jgi:8-oxo-dGTP pyrophosphatase MutT (NUDIX family)
MSAELRIRRKVRAVVVDDSRLLLVLIEVDGVRFWSPPGGTVEAGESDDEALRRELREEVGLIVSAVGPVIAQTTHRLDPATDGHDRQEDYYYAVAIQGTGVDRRPAMSPDTLRAEGVAGSAWWLEPQLLATSDDLRADRPSLVRFLRLAT